MKKFFAFLTALSLVVGHASVFAADSTGAIDKFTVTAPTTAKVGEAIDLTVKALDKSGNVKKDYVGTVYITVENDTKATVPFSDGGYQFKASDQGTMTFSKGLSFTKAGDLKISVMDLENDSVEGSATVKVTAGSTDPLPSTPTTSKETVTITSPDNGSEVPSDSVKLTGLAKKNSKIQVFLNGSKVGEAQTDTTGAFIYDLKKLDQQQNIVQVKVLDGTDKIIGESEKVSFSVATGGPVFTSASIQEGTNVNAGATLNVSVVADAGLKEVSATLGDSTQTLKEGKAGNYAGVLQAPSASGSYDLNVNLKSDLGKVTAKNAALTVTVVDLPNVFKNVKSQVSGKKVTFTFDLESVPKELAKFRFAYGTDSGSLTKESISFEKTKIASASGGYTWYIDNVDPATKYFQIFGLDANNKALDTMKPSDVLEIDFSLAAASKCMVANVSGLKVTANKDSTDLTWDALPEATSYNVYKKGADGNYSLIEAVKTNKYTVHISGDTVKREDFAIKATCNDGENESTDFTEATNVRTGPGQILFLLGLSVVIGFFVTRRKFAFFKGK